MEPEFVLKVHQNELLSLKSQMNLRRENVSCSARKLVEFCLDMTPKASPRHPVYYSWFRDSKLEYSRYLMNVKDPLLCENKQNNPYVSSFGKTITELTTCCGLIE